MARGKRIVYFAEHPAVALIEALVNLESNSGILPDSYQLIKAEASDACSLSTLSPDHLPLDWQDKSVVTRAVGDNWLKTGRSALLAVPSVPSPESLNYLFNPQHADAATIRILWCKRLTYDRRLFQIR
jgi:RES domain-containing protein